MGFERGRGTRDARCRAGWGEEKSKPAPLQSKGAAPGIELWHRHSCLCGFARCWIGCTATSGCAKRKGRAARLGRRALRWGEKRRGGWPCRFIRGETCAHKDPAGRASATFGKEEREGREGRKLGEAGSAVSQEYVEQTGDLRSVLGKGKSKPAPLQSKGAAPKFSFADCLCATRWHPNFRLAIGCGSLPISNIREKNFLLDTRNHSSGEPTSRDLERSYARGGDF